MTELEGLRPLEVQFGDSLPDAIERSLRNTISEGRLAPGTRLREQELSALLDVSATPVREAIQRLSHAGFVDMIPRRGAVVTTLTWDEVTAFLELREVVESYVVRKLATAQLPASQFAECDALLKQMEPLLDENDDTRFLQLDTTFHNLLMKLGDNKPMEEADDIAKRQLQRARAIMQLPPVPPGRIKESHEQHLELIASIKAGNANRSEEALRTHVISVRESLHTQFDEKAQLDDSESPKLQPGGRYSIAAPTVEGPHEPIPHRYSGQNEKDG